MALINAYLWAGVVLGCALILAGAALSVPILNVAGFAVALASLFAAVLRWLNDER